MVDQFWTLPLVCKYWADNQPEAEAFTFLNKHGRHSTCKARDTYVLAGRFASRLRQCGFVHGDVIANAVPNSPERVVTDLGIVMAGCISLNCLILETDGGDFWNTANISKCKGILLPQMPGHPTLKLLSPYILGNSTGLPGYRDISVPKAPNLRKAVIIARERPNDQGHPEKTDDAITQGSQADSTSVENKEGHSKLARTLHFTSSPISGKSKGGTKSVDDKAVSGSEESEPFLPSLLQGSEDVFMADCNPSDNAFIFTTSGSTGYCKLVPKTHEDLLRAARRTIKESKPVKYFTDRPLGWLGGFPFDYYGRCSPTLLQDAFGGQMAKSVKEIWDLLVLEQCDGAFFAPSALSELMDIFQDNPPKFKLKFIMAAGQPMKRNAAAAAGVLGDVLFNMYASTETGAIAVHTIKDVSEFKDFSCGYPIDGVQIRIVDDNLQEVPSGEEGNVLVKSPFMFRNYYKYDSPGPVFTPDGWFMIKDRGMLDEKGMLYIGCRQGDVITQGPILVYLSWPEAVLSKCPEVKDVCIVGVKDNKGIDQLCACVTARKDSGLTEERLLQFYDDNFSSFWDNSEFKPNIRYAIFYEALPVSAAGKLDKKKMREDVRKKFSLG